jgi:hypothetical protein
MVRWNINNIKELERVENKEVKAERKYIAEQSAKVVCSGSPSLGRIEV